MNNGGSRRVPGKTELRRYLEMGLTQQQIADTWDRDSGFRVTRQAIGMAIARYGLESAKPRPRYEDVLPWRVTLEHRMHNDARMLRLEGRSRKGGKLSDKERRLLTQWRAALDEAGAVILYDSETPDGFHWVERAEGEVLVRRPDSD